MSSQIHEVGSVVSFVTVPTGRPPDVLDKHGMKHFVWGYAIVVTSRSTWVITTELVPVFLIHGEIVLRSPDNARSRQA